MGVNEQLKMLVSSFSINRLSRSTSRGGKSSFLDLILRVLLRPKKKLLSTKYCKIQLKNSITTKKLRIKKNVKNVKQRFSLKKISMFKEVAKKLKKV